jgi:hypothetical protein
MRRKFQAIIVIALSLLVLSLNSCGDDAFGGMQSDIPERHDLICMLVDDVWKIVDADDITRTEVSVARGDTVVWQAPADRDIYFQFMDEELTGTFTEELLEGESLTLVIGNDADEGDHPYAVFVHGARAYAEGESPPRMIIR